MTLSLTILGSGSSSGVPRVGGDWGACDPNNPKNRRLRTSLLIEKIGAMGTTRVLIDTSPDLREQLLSAKVSHLDAILLTHPHADHIHGMDDVRPLVQKAGRMIDCYMDEATAQDVLPRFAYIFQTPPGGFYPPLLHHRPLHPPHSITLDGLGGTIEAIPFAVPHGDISALGYRFENIAYTPDLNDIPPSAQPYLEGLDLWIVDALRERPHVSHFHLAQTLSWIEKLKPKKAILTNLHNDLDYETLRKTLPPHIEPAYDGMRIQP